MTSTAPSSLSVEAARAALLAWWDLAGVDVSAPVPPAARQPAAPAAGSRAGRTGAGTAGSGPPAVAPARAALAPPRPADALAQAQAAAAAATSIEALCAAIEAFDGCALKRTARQTVTHDGVPGAPVLLVGEAPGREEDEAGKPFIGRSGQLLDRMLGSIGLSRASNICITNAVYWRPPGNRPPSRDELAICAPFVARFVELSQPRLVLFAGGSAAQSLLGTSTGILKLRGQKLDWQGPDGRTVPAFALLHPAYLLRNPAAKALVWADLLRIQDELSALGLATDGQSSPA